MITWDKFYPFVLPYAPGCPTPVVDAHLQEAAAAFCEDTHVWRFPVEQDFTSRNMDTYEVEVPDGAALEAILALYVDGRPCFPVFDAHVTPAPSSPVGRPTAFAIHQGSQVRFLPTPDDKYPFEGVAVAKPSMTARGVEDFLFEHYARAISDGTLMRLLQIPNKEWTNLELSAYYTQQFAKARAEARIRDTRGVELHVRPRNFATSSRQGRT